jgi:hypothetical protein
LREYYANRKHYNDEVVRLTRLLDGYTDETGKYHEGYRDQKSRYEDLRDNYLKQKIALNKAFYTKYAPYILEGTWIDEQYTDDDKYYLDAQATLNNSCLPQITYNINVIDVSQQSQYSKRQYDVGDQTYIQDPEYFGWDKTENSKTPRRQKVTISETVEILD